MVRELTIRCEYCDNPGEACEISIPEGKGVADLCVKHREPLVKILKVARAPQLKSNTPSGRLLESRIRGV